jgi:hypothetical protein
MRHFPRLNRVAYGILRRRHPTVLTLLEQKTAGFRRDLGRRAPPVGYCASVSPSGRCVSRNVRPPPSSVSDNVRRKWPSIARRTVHYCAPLQVSGRSAPSLSAHLTWPFTLHKRRRTDPVRIRVAINGPSTVLGCSDTTRIAIRLPPRLPQPRAAGPNLLKADAGELTRPLAQPSVDCVDSADRALRDVWTLAAGSCGRSRRIIIMRHCDAPPRAISASPVSSPVAEMA